MKEMSEHDVQKVAVALLRKAGVRFFAVPNGGLRTAATAVKLWKEGVEKGVPDLVIVDRPPAFPQFVGTVVEVKTKTGRPTEEQQKWLRHFSSLGWSANWTKGIAELLDTLRILGYLDEVAISPWMRLAGAEGDGSTAPCPTEATGLRTEAAPGRPSNTPQKRPRKGKDGAG